MSVFKVDLAKQLRSELPDDITSQEQAMRILNTTLNLIQENVKNGESVVLRNFGTFDMLRREKKHYKDFQTGELKYAKAKRVPRFKAGEGFKEATKLKRGRPKKV